MKINSDRRVNGVFFSSNFICCSYAFCLYLHLTSRVCSSSSSFHANPMAVFTNSIKTGMIDWGE